MYAAGCLIAIVITACITAMIAGNMTRAEFDRAMFRFISEQNRARMSEQPTSPQHDVVFEDRPKHTIPGLRTRRRDILIIQVPTEDPTSCRWELDYRTVAGMITRSDQTFLSNTLTRLKAAHSHVVWDENYVFAPGSSDETNRVFLERMDAVCLYEEVKSAGEKMKSVVVVASFFYSASLGGGTDHWFLRET